jgi:hypothetical protein
MAEIMFDDQKTRVVLLNRSFGADGRNMKELRARLTDEGAMFFQFLQDATPVKYGLSTAEADAFVESWLADRAERKAKELAEQERQAQAIAEAYSIAASWPGIKIEEKEAKHEDGKMRPAWYVSIPETGWNCGSHSEWSYFPHELLEHTKHARAALQGRIGTQAFA